MARGWESKSVEDQKEVAEARRGLRNSAAHALTPEQVERQHERESLQMQLTRLHHEHDTSQHPRRQQQLQEAIRFLEDKLASLD